MDSYVAKKLGLSKNEYSNILNSYKHLIIYRAKTEIMYWNQCIEEIQKYTREKAIEELIKAKKLHEKINAINSYINKLCK